MTRDEQSSINRAVVARVAELVGDRYFRVPSYRVVVATLNAEGYRTSRGSVWTPQRLFRMLQRQGISGLWGLSQLQHQK